MVVGVAMVIRELQMVRMSKAQVVVVEVVAAVEVEAAVVAVALRIALQTFRQLPHGQLMATAKR